MDIFWIITAAILVFLMQAGFLCLESGLVRSKNSINVAAKNITDFMISSLVFWAFGFAIMFGDSFGGWFGTSHFFFGKDASAYITACFLFQMMFCGTAATLVSGAVAERMSFFGYVAVTITITLFIYPLVGHWAWGGIIKGEAAGWLENLGFVDFAGSTVVHSVGGWVSLAAILIIGPRTGRFDVERRKIPGSNVPMAALGCLLIWFGWFGFNGGSTLGWTEQVPGILLNTCLAACAGGIAAGFFHYLSRRYMDVHMIINGVLGGLVSITANCNSVDPLSAVTIGLIGGYIVHVGDSYLEKKKIDDSVGVIPVHLFAGIWGTLAVALFSDPEIIGKRLPWYNQMLVQATGIIAIGLYSFVIAFAFLKIVNRFAHLRVSNESELIGLNVSEHRVSTEVFDLLSAMHHQQQKADFSLQVPVEPFTEVGQIAQQYNRVIKKVNEEIQQRDKAFEAFRQSEYRKGAILEAAMDCIISINERGHILEFNPAAEQCFGIVKRNVHGQNFFELFMAPDAVKIALQSLSQGFALGDGLVLKRRNITELRRSNSEAFPAEVVITQTTEIGNTIREYTLHVRDITQQLKLQNRLKVLAYKDTLTGLYNRNYFIENLKQRIAFHQTYPGSVALMFLDLDRFKTINDTLGHNAGDELLRQVAARLNSLVRGVDLVGRWGGDEFVIVMSGDVDVDTATARADSILAQMNIPMDISGHNLTVLTSIGIAFSENGTVNADRLLQHADLAMYKAKQMGRNTYQIFKGDMEEEAQHQFRLESALPEAIAQNQLELLYQPKVSCTTDEVVSFEALLRWNHPEYGIMLPGQFIPVIEESNLIIQLGEWVLESAIKQLYAWQQQGLPLLPIAVNISGRHLHSPSLTPFVKSLMEEYDLPKKILELEITESVLAGNTNESIEAMTGLKSIGIRIAIDDFGTGYSSLSYLKRFPVDVLKIDRAFVSECASNAEDAAICTAIITIAKSLGLNTVAEGVETREQLVFLKEKGCDAYQGYYFSHPLAAEHIPTLLYQVSDSGVI